MEYKVVYGSSDTCYEAIEKLELEVRKLIGRGWKPQGGISFSETEYKWHTICQAMVKE